MTAFLPPNLLALFAPREPLGFLPPTDQRPWEKKPWLYSGVAQYLEDFEVKKILLISSITLCHVISLIRILKRLLNLRKERQETKGGLERLLMMGVVC